MIVENLQSIYRFQQILWRIDFQELAALFKQQFVIRADVSWTVRHDAFIKVTQGTFGLGFVIIITVNNRVVRAFTQLG